MRLKLSKRARHFIIVFCSVAIRQLDGAHAHAHAGEAVRVPALRATLQHAQQPRQASCGQLLIFNPATFKFLHIFLNKYFSFLSVE